MGAIVVYVVGGGSMVLGGVGVFSSASALGRRGDAGRPHRLIIGAVLTGMFWLLLGVGMIVAQTTSSMTALVALLIPGLVAQVASLVVAGPIHWRAIGNPATWRGDPPRSST